MSEYICNDKAINLFIYLQSIIPAIRIISIILILFIIVHFIVKIKTYKHKNILIKKLIKTLIVIIILSLIILNKNYVNSLINKTDECLEEEEKSSINNISFDVKPSLNIELKENIDKEELRDNNFYFLNVGPGTESFIIEDNGHFGLIDTSYNSKASYILKQLELLGAKELDFLLITHSHLDHMGGFDKIMSNIKVKTLYIKVPGNVNSNYTETYKHMLDKAEEENTTICDVKEELCQSIDLENIFIKLYNYPFHTSNNISGLQRSRIENANSIVAVAEVNNRRIYFSSDIGNYENNNVEIELSKEIGDIDVYKVSHHGFTSYNNHTQALANLKPEYGIVSNTKTLSRNAINRLKETNPGYLKTYYTTDGTITLHVEDDSTLIFNQ